MRVLHACCRREPGGPHSLLCRLLRRLRVAIGRCDHEIIEQGDQVAYNPKDAQGKTVWFAWCARCGALRVTGDHWPDRWNRPKRDGGDPLEGVS